MRRPLLPLLAVAAALVAAPTWAGVFDGDALEANARLRDEHGARLDKLEEAARNQVETANQVDGLKAEVAKLRGQVEVLTFDLGQAQKRSQDYYVDLDNRLRKLEAAGDMAKTPPASDPVAETQAFETALGLFKANKFKEAAESFRAFIAAYPTSSFAPSAYYWAGNAHFQLREWAKAVESYNTLAQKWPADAKAPDALLQLADARGQSGDAKAERKALEDLVARYPDSPAAGTARQRLKKGKR